MAEFPIGIDIPRRSTPSISSPSGVGMGLTSPPNASSTSTSFGGTSTPRIPLTPSGSSSSNPFENFSVPAIPPRLSRVGRRISELGMNVLVGPDLDDSTPSSASGGGGGRRDTASSMTDDEVPGMGDEPIMCPFCNKPLPPALIISQMAHNHATSREKRRSVALGSFSSGSGSTGIGGEGGMERKGSIRRPSGLGLSRVAETPTGAGAGGGGGSVAMTPAASAPPSAIHTRDPGPAAGIAKGLAPVETRASLSVDSLPLALHTDITPLADPSLPKATAESLLPSVKAGETTDIAAAASIISAEEIKRWTSKAGISLDSSSTSTSATAPASSSSSTGTVIPTTGPAEKIEKAIPAIPPPPPPSSTAADRLKKTDRSGSGSSSPASNRFSNFFGRSSPKPEVGDSDDEEDDGLIPAGGYARLDAPPSPDREEAPRRKVERKEVEKEKEKDKPITPGRDTPPGALATAAASPAPVTTGSSVTASASGATKQDEELRKLLVEVLGKVNVMSKTHEDLLHSHTSLLTSLKIARSNLAMAEANSEMLEEQLKRNTSATPKPIAVQQQQPARSVSQTSRPSTPSGSSTSAAAGSAPTSLPVPTRTSTLPAPPTIVVPPGSGVRKSLDETRPSTLSANPKNPTPRRSEETRRPVSLVMPPPNIYNTGPMTGPATTRPTTESKGMFGFLGGKTKLPGGLGTITIPTAKELQASAARFGDSLAGPQPSRPSTPSKEYPGQGQDRGQFFDFHVPSAYGPVLNVPHEDDPGSGSGSGSGLKRSVSQGGSGSSRVPSRATSPVPGPSSTAGNNNNGQTQRSVSSGSALSPSSTLTSPLAGGIPSGPPLTVNRPTPIPPAIAAELTKLRNLHSSSTTKMEAMSKEFTELKKGKIEMEAELESLSQALFEEANKMVSDERRKRAEVEDSLREVKEEREVLRQTIKVLGGAGGAGADQQGGVAPEIKGEGAEGQDNDKDKAKEKKEKDQEEDEEEWRPRDLDKHYAALRKTIHHVADGTAPTAAFSEAVAVPNDATSTSNAEGSLPSSLRSSTDANTDIGMDETPRIPGGFGPAGAAMQEANPWAEVDFGMGAGSTTGMSMSTTRDGVSAKGEQGEGRLGGLEMNRSGSGLGTEEEEVDPLAPPNAAFAGRKELAGADADDR